MVTAKKRIENIKKYHVQIESAAPGDRQMYRSKIEYNIKKMIEAGYIKIVCNVDTREQLPYTESEIDLPINTIKNDVGDYNFIIFIDQGEGYKTVRYEAGLVIERKTCQDLYGTLMNRGNRGRFYREVNRFKGDIFLLFAECDINEFYIYLPDLPKICKYCEKCEINGTGNDKTFTCMLNKTSPKNKKYNDVCKKIEVHVRTDREVIDDINRKRGTIAGLRERGVHVCWEGSRGNAVKDVKPTVEQWIMKNYEKVFGL